jgi:hypothetical protein
MAIVDRFHTAYAHVAMLSGVKVLKAADSVEEVTQRTYDDEGWHPPHDG